MRRLDTKIEKKIQAGRQEGRQARTQLARLRMPDEQIAGEVKGRKTCVLNMRYFLPARQEAADRCEPTKGSYHARTTSTKATRLAPANTAKNLPRRHGPNRITNDINASYHAIHRCRLARSLCGSALVCTLPYSRGSTIARQVWTKNKLKRQNAG